MQVRLLYFAWVRETIGRGEELVDVPDGIETIADLAAYLARRGGSYATAMGDPRLRAAVDQIMAAFDTPIANAREIAFFPPVTGG